MVNTFVRLPILLYKQWNYMFEGSQISPAFDADLCAIACDTPEESEIP